MNTQTLVRARLRGHLPAAKAPPLLLLAFLLRTEQGRSTVAAKFPFCFHLSPSIFQRDLVRPEQLGHLQAELPPCWPGLLPLGSILTTPPAPLPLPATLLSQFFSHSPSSSLWDQSKQSQVSQGQGRSIKTSGPELCLPRF